MNNFKSKQLSSKNNRMQNSPVDTPEDTHIATFSFRFLDHKQINKYQQNDFNEIIKNLITISSYTWRDIIQLGKNGIGYELIPLSELKCPIPKDDLFNQRDKATVFHKQGDKIPLIGFKVNDVFYLFYLDRGLKAYKH